jgi:succinate dehydrogenase/fumarate reductase cytochrome b subunit (b558 family)
VPHDARPHRTALRLFSLSGVLPLGAFLVVHAIANARALRGDDAFAAAVGWFQRIPALGLVEVLFIWVPLALHAGVGVWLTVTRTPLTHPSPYPPGVRVAMRVTGVVAIAFLAMHLPELRFRTPGERPDGGALLTALTSDLSSTRHGVPWRAVAYLAAAGCVTFHFASGLWGFLATCWGGEGGGAGEGESKAGTGARARRLRRATAWAAAILGGSLWVLLTDVVVLHATGVRLIGNPSPSQEPAWPGRPGSPTGSDCPAATNGANATNATQ